MCLKDNQYTDLALKALKAYTEQTTVVIDPFISMQLSVIHPIGEQGILENRESLLQIRLMLISRLMHLPCLHLPFAVVVRNSH